MHKNFKDEFVTVCEFSENVYKVSMNAYTGTINVHKNDEIIGLYPIDVSKLLNKKEE